MQDAAIELHQVSKIFRNARMETTAVNAVSLQVAQGEYLSIQGKSGSGKSSLLAVMGLIEPYEGGSLRIGGRDVGPLTVDQRAELRCQTFGFVYQFFHLIGDLSVAENIALPMRFAGRKTAEIRDRVNALLQAMDLDHRRDHWPAQLSGGQQQRVAIARALANTPSILLVDEPTGNLDSESGALVMQALEQIHRDGATLILVTHDNELAARAQRRARMQDGHFECLSSARAALQVARA